ncbi:MAG TPA: hypothetical protein VKD23_09430 [Terriglobales bacterium]|nr:hypothetical protein [Terriglobales bacterium]
MMKRTLAYVGHIVIATLAVPWLTILAGGLIYGVFSPFLTSVNTPQQFLSDHLMFLVVVVGASLAYAVSGTFTSRSALWVWIPATIVFVLRVLDWRATGSALVGSGSFIEHFFTANCQFNNWREGGFDSRCPDKLFLTPLFIGGLSYSAGAAIHRVIHYWRPPKDAPTTPVGAMPGRLQVVTTPFAALFALAFTGSVLGRRFHEEVAARPSSWTWLSFGSLPTWLVVTINIAIWGGIYAIGINFARAPFRRDEKALFVSLVGSFMLLPVAALLPKTSGLIHIAQTMLNLTALLAALAILLSLRKERSGSLPSENG